MASDRILALNVGAGHVSLGEFKIAAGKPPVLQRYGIAPLGLDPDSEMDPSGFIIAAIGDLMKSSGIRPGPLMMAVSGQMVFPRFVKFPSIAQDKLRAMIQSEAEQNIPFPIDECTWDCQMIGTDEMGEQNAMIVASKTDGIVALTNSIGAARLEPEIVDVAPLAIYNCVIGGGAGDGCTMVLDVGSRSTNLVFVEEGKVFYRSIPVAGNAITSEIAKTFGIDFKAAEQLKREIGFVALGGVTATEDEDADKASKCIRGVVTRLHAEVNRSINFYRSQQGGSAPSRVLLTGGSAALRHLDTFFREKLRLDVDYLNPFTGITLGSHVNQEKASSDFLRLAEIVGLALRRAGMGRVEINLMPPNLVQKKTFRRQAPVLIASAAALAAAAGMLFLAAGEKAGLAEYERDACGAKLRGLESVGSKISARVKECEAIAADLEQYRSLVASRDFVLRSVNDIRGSMLPGTWLVSFESAEIEPGAEKGVEEEEPRGGRARRGREEDAAPAKVPGYRIVAKGFQDVLRRVEQEARATGKTAPEIFCGLLSAKPAFASAKVVGQKVVDADNTVEFTIEAALAQARPGTDGAKTE
jgi:type IV pilus assembly protein PilM